MVVVDTFTLEHISVQTGSIAFGKKHLYNGKIQITSKQIFVGSGNYKIPWKKVEQVEVKENDLITITSSSHVVECSMPPIACRRLVEHYWRKWQRKRQAEEEPATPKKTYGGHRRTYVSKRSKFLAANASNFESEDDDDDQVFNRAKRRATEPESVEEEEAHTDSEQELQDEAPSLNDEEQEEEEVPEDEPTPKPSRKRRLIKKRITDDDSDEDDDIFETVTTTISRTPATKAQRVVSPAVAQQEDQQDEEEEEEAQLDDLEDEGDATSRQGLQDITNFFGKKPAGKSTAKTQEPPSPPRALTPLKERAVTSANKKLAEPKSNPPPSPASPPVSKNDALTPVKERKYASVNKKTALHSFFVPRRPSAPLTPPLESQDTVIESSTPSTVVPSPASTMANDATPTTTPPTRKKYRLDFEEPANPEADDPIEDSQEIDSPLRSSVKRKVIKPRLLKTYGKPRQIANEFKDTATMALELTTPPRNNLYITPKPVSPKWKGLRNLGNTCYMNASLQMLYSVPMFVSALEYYRQGHRLVQGICELAKELQAETVGAATAKPIKVEVDAKTDKFRGYQQRDAHEFLGDLLDQIHEELEPEKENQDEADDDKPSLPTDEHFRLNVEVCLECKSCGYARTKNEMYRYLSIDITDGQRADEDEEEVSPTKRTVDHCLQQFFRPEEREIKCEKCEEGTEATQTMRILSRPKAILLHLKRFVLVEKPRIEGENRSPNTAMVEMTFRKNKDPVVLSERLSLDSFLKQSESKATPQQYSVQSIVHHIGNTANSGHYTADALRKKDDKKQWVSFDDGITNESTAQRILRCEENERTAYMLLYTAD